MKTYGIDIAALSHEQPTGVEQYVRMLVLELMKLELLPEEEVVFYAPKEKPEWLTLPSGFRYAELGYPLPKGFTHVRLSLELLLRPPSVFFSPAHEIPLCTGRARVLSTVHDVAFRHFPESYSGKNRARQEIAMRRVAKRAHRVIAVSESTKGDLVKLYGIPEARIAVAPLAPISDITPGEQEVQRVLNGYGLSRSHYIFFVGRIEEKKNVATLIRAFTVLKEKLGVGHPLKLVLAGMDGYGAKRIHEEARASSVAEDIRFLGYVPDEHVRALAAGAFLFTFPSLYEGFGLPLLEAMRLGTPLLVSDIPVFREVAGESALFVPAKDVGAWVDAFKKFIYEDALREELIRKGREQVTHFSVRRMAEQTLAALRAA